MLGATRPALAPALSVLFLTLVAAAGQADPTAAPEAPTVVSTSSTLVQDSISATLRSVREDGIEVITGVQYVLKITFIAVDSATAIRKQGESVAVQTLQPGDVVVVRYRETEEGKVAESIVAEPPRRQGGGR